MKRILFVDDEPKILEGLQRMLHPHRNRWQMTFANGGQEALKALANGVFDVIVTDMRMPGMDGAQLLEVVQQRYPGMIRIVLSGYFENQAAIRAVPVAHQFLMKPCDPLKLRDAIDRTCQCDALLTDAGTRRVVAAIGELPALRRTSAALMRALQNPETTLGEVGKIVEQDVGVSAKVLQLVNSAFFGLTQEISTIRGAVSYLGLDVLKQLVLTVEVFRTFQPRATAPAFSLEAIQAHSGFAARIVARLPVAKRVASSCGVAALLHDAGKLILAARLPDQFEAAATQAFREHRPLHVVEKELLGTTHAEIGAYLLGLWGLAPAIVSAASRHHHPARPDLNLTVPEPGDTAGLDTVSAVYVANILAHEYETEALSLPEATHDAMDLDYLDGIGVSSQLPAWRTMTGQIAEEIHN